MVVADGKGLPLGSTLHSASPAEVTLIEETLEQLRLRDRRRRPKPKRLIYDRAADSDKLRKRLRQRGIDLICPHRRGRKAKPMQDGRKLKRYRRRWKMERTFAWLGNYRRLLVRHERIIEIYHAFFRIACIMIIINGF
jgi:transposase